VERPRRAYPRFAVASALAFALVLVLVWALVLRERSTRRLYLEYEAYRASAALMEAYRESPSLEFSDDRVRGFGIYGADGTPIVRSGTAPERLDAKSLATAYGWTPLRDSFVLARPLGPGIIGMESMPGPWPMEGSGHMQGMGRGMGRIGGFGASPPLAPPRAGPETFGPPSSQPRALWLEYGLGGFNKEQALLAVGALAASLALAGLYLVLLALYRRNAELAEREFKNRELVQLGDAARTLVHEIKNPLGIIRIQAASLRKLDAADAVAKAAEKSALIEEEVLRLASLADRIREFLKGGEGAPREIELGPWLIEFAARYAGAGEGEEVALGDIEKGARARIDPERLSLAVGNLVRNALDACRGAPPPLLSLSARGRRWEISVADRGSGVPPNLVGRLFEPFFTTKERGSGIGLALARRVALSAGGELEYRPRPGGGSVFSILLPALK